MRRVTWLAVLVPVALLTAWPALAKSPIDDAALDRTTALGAQEPDPGAPDPKVEDAAASYADPRVNLTGKESIGRALEPPQRRTFGVLVPTNLYEMLGPGRLPR